MTIVAAAIADKLLVIVVTHIVIIGVLMIIHHPAMKLPISRHLVHLTVQPVLLSWEIGQFSQ